MSRKNRDRGASREIDWDWWVYSVGINFLPLLASMLGNFYQYDAINMSALMGSGELVMCAFFDFACSHEGTQKFSAKRCGLELILFPCRVSYLSGSV